MNNIKNEKLCEICLGTDENLILKPCSCGFKEKKTHESCLELWCQSAISKVKGVKKKRKYSMAC